MTATLASFNAVFGITTGFAASMLQAAVLGQSASFGVGATVVDLCQIPDAFSGYLTVPTRQLNQLCSVPRPANDVVLKPIATVTRAVDGTITALNLEF